MAAQDVAKGSPSKGFFVSMITRDISLGDSILDLLDNSVDGVRRTQLKPDNASPGPFWAKVSYSATEFNLHDNCGGIPLEVARDYAFRFGKPDDVAVEPHAIGLYGIGMKRALFKMGRTIKVKSSTGHESFVVNINVDEWRKQGENNWDFPITEVVEQGTGEPAGTQITVSDLYEWISREFETPTFSNALLRTIQRDYALILQKGFEVVVNDFKVQGKIPTLRTGGELAPVRFEYLDEGVRVEITAGLGAPPPEDDSSEHRYPEQDIYGWYVACNDRVIVTADKTHLTGWGVDSAPAWHAQYFGFLGFVHFESSDPKLLPWRTTKRDLDSSSGVYKRALVKMREITREFIEYTNNRKSELSRIRKLELQAAPVQIVSVPLRPRISLPQIQTQTLRRICFDKPQTEIDAVAKALGIRFTSVKQVGIAAFDYVRKNEVDPERG